MVISQLRDDLKTGFSQILQELERSRNSTNIQLENISSQIANIQLGLGDGLERISAQWLRLDLVKRGYNNVNLEIS